MATNITYNGKSLPYPLPLVSREEAPIRYGAKWGTQYRYTLQGSLVNCSGYSFLTDQRADLLATFNKDFQALSITDDDLNITAPICSIENVEFGASDYLYNVPYSVTIATYPSDFFEINGVLDPVDTWEFQETEDKTIRLNHEVSAKGFETSATATNSLRDAINFVQQRTGVALPTLPTPQFIVGAGDYVLESQNESLNRLNGTYSVSETYLKDQVSAGMVKRYFVDLNSGLDGFINVSINGSVDGGVNANLADVRSEYNAFDIFSIVTGIYTETTTNTDLNVWPISSGISEDPYQKNIIFDINYDNNPDPLINLVYNASVSESDTTTTISLDGEIIGRGDITNRWSEVQNYYRTIFDSYDLAVSGYSWHGGTYTVNPKPVTSGVTFDSYRGTISFGIAYDDKPQPPARFKDFNYVISFTPPIRQVRSQGFYGLPPLPFSKGAGEYYLTDLGYYNKTELSINGTAVLEDVLPTDVTITLLNNEIDKLFFTYANAGAIRIRKDIVFVPPLGQQVNFNFSWIFDGAYVNNTGNYGLIVNLNTKT